MTDTATATGRLDEAGSRASCSATARRGTPTAAAAAGPHGPGHRLRRRGVAADDALPRRRARVPRARVGRDPRPRVRDPEGPFLAADGPSLTFRWRGTGTFTGRMDPPGFAPTNGRIDFTGFDLHEYRDGRLEPARHPLRQRRGGPAGRRDAGGRVARRAGRRGAPAPHCAAMRQRALTRTHAACWIELSGARRGVRGSDHEAVADACSPSRPAARRSAGGSRGRRPSCRCPTGGCRRTAGGRPSRR